MIRYKDFVDFLRLFWQQQKQIMYRLLKKNREFFHSEARILWWCLNHRGHLLYKMWQKIFHQPHRHNGHLIPRNHLIYSHNQRLQRNCSRFLKTVFHQPPPIPSAIIVEAVVEKPSLSALVSCSHRNHFVLFTALTHKKDIPSLKTGNTSAMFFLRCLLLKQ